MDKIADDIILRYLSMM